MFDFLKKLFKSAPAEPVKTEVPKAQRKPNSMMQPRPWQGKHVVTVQLR